MPSRPTARQRVLGLARKAASPRVKAAARRAGGRPLVAYERRGLTPELSVVVPVYNVARYLRECLDSALNQSLHNLEVIAVDDGSTDGSLDILREYERHDPRVRVLAQANSGQGIARNAGVALARGEFLTFLDSDDTVPPRAYEHMVAGLRESGSDFSVGSVRRLKNNEYIRTIWARTVHASDRIGTTIEAYPNAMQDIIACNRMFRTEFWRDRIGEFQGHIAYEDHVPMLAAYVRAKRFDILSEVTYNWRIREDLTSTGQQKARLKNLLDRIAVKEEAHELLREEASDFVYDTWIGRTLEVDFPPFVVHGLAGDAGYRNLLAATYATFLGRATDAALDRVSVRQKIRAELVAHQRWDDVVTVDEHLPDMRFVPATTVVDGAVVAVLPPELDFVGELPPRVLRLSPLESHFEGCVEHVEWLPDGVRLTGWGVRRGVAITGEHADIAVRLVDGEQSVDLDVTPEFLTDANIWGRQEYAAYDGAGFHATLPFVRLPRRRGRWAVEVAVTYSGLTSSGTILNRVNESATLRTTGALAELDGGQALVRARWDSAIGLCIDVEPDPVRLTSVGLTTEHATGTLTVPAGRELRRVRLEHPDRAPVPARLRRDGDRADFTADLPPHAGEDVALWRLVARGPGLAHSPVWQVHTAPNTRLGLGWQPGADGGAELVATPQRIEVLDVRLGDDTLEIDVDGTGLSDTQAAALVLGNPRVHLRQTSATREGGCWRLGYSLLTSSFGGPEHIAPKAKYQLWLDTPAGRASARVANAYGGLMPQRMYGTQVNLRVAQHRDGVLVLDVGAPLPPAAQGAANRRRMRDHFRSTEVTPVDGVLFSCYRGEFATDSQLALDRALATARPDLTRFWGVADRSTQVPAGAVPVQMDGQQWYDVLASSRYLCNNIDYGPYFARRDFQHYLQTFHGYPFKSMGIQWWRERGFTADQIRMNLARVNREWDTLLVPSEACVAYYREQYDFAGPILATGYPRCDALVNADADAVRAAVLGRLGVDPSTTVVLYAPTYRDWLTTRLYAAARFDDLDLAGLAGQLGESYTVLVRGHNNNQRETDRVRGVARVVDVTDYPDVNDLTLAADVAVLDYSSLRFDWAITGKPMVFFVPDLDDYFATRKPLFPYEGTAPGPWTATTAEVAAALTDLPGIRARYGAEVEAFNAAFNGLHDGHATERVVAAFFEQDLS